MSLNVLKTSYMVFIPRNRLIYDIDLDIHGVQIQRVNATKFLGVQIDSQLIRKSHIECTCKKLSKCVGILCKARKNVQIDSHQLILFLCILLFCLLQSCMGINTLPVLKEYPIQKKLFRIITCSPFWAHMEPLYFANKILNVCDINDYIIGTFMFECLYDNFPDIFRNYLKCWCTWS